jgi:hypothetical protein
MFAAMLVAAAAAFVAPSVAGGVCAVARQRGPAAASFHRHVGSWVD